MLSEHLLRILHSLWQWKEQWCGLYGNRGSRCCSPFTWMFGFILPRGLSAPQELLKNMYGSNIQFFMGKIAAMGKENKLLASSKVVSICVKACVMSVPASTLFSQFIRLSQLLWSNETGFCKGKYLSMSMDTPHMRAVFHPVLGRPVKDDLLLLMKTTTWLF